MPLLSGKKNIGHNIAVERAAGKPEDQAVAIAMSKAGESKGKDTSEFKRGDVVTSDVTPKTGTVLSVEGTGDMAKVLVRFGAPDKYDVSDVRKLYAYLLRKPAGDSLPAPVAVGKDASIDPYTKANEGERAVKAFESSLDGRKYLAAMEVDNKGPKSLPSAEFKRLDNKAQALYQKADLRYWKDKANDDLPAPVTVCEDSAETDWRTEMKAKFKDALLKAGYAPDEAREWAIEASKSGGKVPADIKKALGKWGELWHVGTKDSLPAPVAVGKDAGKWTVSYLDDYDFAHRTQFNDVNAARAAVSKLKSTKLYKHGGISDVEIEAPDGKRVSVGDWSPTDTFKPKGGIPCAKCGRSVSQTQRTASGRVLCAGCRVAAEAKDAGNMVMCPFCRTRQKIDEDGYFPPHKDKRGESCINARARALLRQIGGKAMDAVEKCPECGGQTKPSIPGKIYCPKCEKQFWDKKNMAAIKDPNSMYNQYRRSSRAKDRRHAADRALPSQGSPMYINV